MANQQQGTLLVEGKRRYVFQLPDGRRVTGQNLRARADWAWRDRTQVPGHRDARLTATSPTSRAVTIVIVDERGAERYDRLCQATSLTAPGLIRAWQRRRCIEYTFQTLQHLLATGVCQVAGEDAYDGRLVLRLPAGWSDSIPPACSSQGG